MNSVQYRMTSGTEIRADSENRSISGFGIVFNSDSEPLMIFDGGSQRFLKVVERITPESVQDADMSDVISAFNHDFDKILGRTTSGTLRLEQMQRGIFFRADAPNTSYADDVLELLRRGDVNGASFVFTMDMEEGYDIIERADGVLQASPIKINRIMEIGPVVTPAYPETSAHNRSSALQDAVKRFLDAQSEDETQERGEEQPGEGEQPKAEVNTQNQDITYPVTVTYKTKAKVMQLKNKRV